MTMFTVSVSWPHFLTPYTENIQKPAKRDYWQTLSLSLTHSDSDTPTLSKLISERQTQANRHMATV